MQSKKIALALLVFLPATVSKTSAQLSVEHAQGLPDFPTPHVSALWTTAPKETLYSRFGTPPDHRFYDRPGKALVYLAVGAALADSGITCYNLHMGQGEYVLPTQSCPQVTTILLGQVTAQEGVAYFLHRTHHHVLERAIRAYSISANLDGFITSYKARL
jgi:hypothetical protein